MMHYYLDSKNWKPSWTTDGSSDSGVFHFLWISERSGFKQMYFYRYGRDGGMSEVLLGGSALGPGGSYVVDRCARLVVNTFFVVV